MFKRRLGQTDGNQCEGGRYCPQILEMTDGAFAAAGLDITKAAIPALPPGPGVGPDEGIVKVPRKVMLAAMADILTTA